MAKKQTAGRNNLGDLAPKFAQLNDDVLFGEVPTTLKELGAADDPPLEEIANSVPLAPGGYGKLTHQDVLDIFREAMG